MIVWFMVMSVFYPFHFDISQFKGWMIKNRHPFSTICEYARQIGGSNLVSSQCRLTFGVLLHLTKLAKLSTIFVELKFLTRGICEVCNFVRALGVAQNPLWFEQEIYQERHCLEGCIGRTTLGLDTRISGPSESMKRYRNQLISQLSEILINQLSNSQIACVLKY